MMEIKICIIEDEAQFQISLQKLIEEWGEKNDVIPVISVDSSGKNLTHKNCVDYHIIFLDIQLKEMTGIEAAHKLRAMNYKGEIVFLTAYREYVFEGYSVHALNYFLKPIRYEEVDYCLQFVKNQLSASYFTYRYHSDIIKIPYNDILYFSSNNQYVEIYTLISTYRQINTLKKILTYLPEQFMQCHRTIIVNIQHIEKLIGKEIYLFNGTQLPISNTYLKKIQIQFLHYIRE